MPIANVRIGCEDAFAAIAQTLFGCLLKLPGGGREIGVFVSEKLVGYFAGQEHAYVGAFVNRPAYEIHSHACADSRYIVRPEKVYDLLQRRDNVFGSHINLCVIGADEVGDLTRVFEVDRVFAHAYRERTDRM